MTELWSQLLRWASLSSFVLSAGVIWWASGGVLRCALSRRWTAHLRAVRHQVAFLRLAVPAERLLQLQAGACGAALLGLVASLWWLSLIFVGAALSVMPALLHRRDKRVLALEEQLDGWLQTLSGLLHSTGSLGEALEESIGLTPAPLAEELEVTARQLRLGSSLEESLDMLAERVGSRPLRSALGALKVSARSGGELRSALTDSAAVLREMARLEGVLRTRTAEARSQGVVLALMPLALAAGLSWMDPNFLRPLIDSTSGHLLLAAVCGMWLTGLVWMRRILDVDF